MKISSNIPHSSTGNSPTIGELSATLQELSVVISEISNNALPDTHASWQLAIGNV